MCRKATGCWSRHLGAVILAVAIFLVGQTPGTALAGGEDLWFLTVKFSGSGTYTATVVNNDGHEESYTFTFNFSFESHNPVALIDLGNNLPDLSQPPKELDAERFDSITGTYLQQDNDCCDPPLDSCGCPWEFLNGTIYKDTSDTAADNYEFQVWEDYLNRQYVFQLVAEPSALSCVPNPCCSADPGTMQCGIGYLLGPLGDSQGDPIEFWVSISTFKNFKKFVQNYNYTMNAAALQKAGWSGFGADDPSAQVTWQGTLEIDVESYQHFGAKTSANIPAYLMLLLPPD
jgi:hypothetical protein